jgi:hypothetical protein
MSPGFGPTAVVGIVILTACTTANQPLPPSDRVLATTDVGTIRARDAVAAQSTLNATPDAAFAALKAAYSDLGINIKMIDPTTRTLGNKRFSKMYDLKGVRLSKYVGCGSTETGPTADSYRVTMSIVSHVTPLDTGSRIDTQLTAYAQDLGSSKGALSCMTLGGLEQRIHELAVKHAGG